MPSNHISNKDYNDFVETGGHVEPSTRRPTAIEHLFDEIHQCHKDSVTGQGGKVPIRIMDALRDAEQSHDNWIDSPEDVVKELIDRIAQKVADKKEVL